MATERPEKPAAQFFATVTDMRTLSAEKIDAFCEDLRLWLQMHKQVDRLQEELGEFAHAIKITSPSDRFGWVDDGRHDANISVTFLQEPASPASVDAVDPVAGKG